MKKAALLLIVCMAAASVFCSFSNHQLAPAKELAAEAIQKETQQEKSTDITEGKKPHTTKADVKKEVPKEPDQETIPDSADKMAIENDTAKADTDKIIFVQHLPCIKTGEEPPKWEPNLLLSKLDFNKDGLVDREDYRVSGMSREEFAERLLKNGNVGTSEEAQWLIDGDIASSYGIVY